MDLKSASRGMWQTTKHVWPPLLSTHSVEFANKIIKDAAKNKDAAEAKKIKEDMNEFTKFVDIILDKDTSEEALSKKLAELRIRLSKYVLLFQ